jgi:hypothetical protein
MLRSDYYETSMLFLLVYDWKKIVDFATFLLNCNGVHHFFLLPLSRAKVVSETRLTEKSISIGIK